MSQKIYKRFFLILTVWGFKKTTITKNEKRQTSNQLQFLRNTKNTKLKRIKFVYKEISISKKPKITMCKTKKQKRYIGKTLLLLSWLSYFKPHKKIHKNKTILTIVFNVLIKQALVKICSFFTKFLCFINQLYQKKTTTVSISYSIRKLLLRKPKTRLKTC